MSSGGRPLGGLLVECAQQGEDLAGDVALEAADDLLAGLVFGCAASGVGAGGLMPSQSDDHDAVEGGVGLPVAAAVDSLGRLGCQAGAWLRLTMLGGASRLRVGKVASCPASRCDLICAVT